MDATDAAKLFDEDRQRFLTLYREWLTNSAVPLDQRWDEANATIGAMMQIKLSIGLPRG